MINVVLDQGAFGLKNSLFNRMELLGNIRAGSIVLDHCNHAEEVAIGTFQPLCDIGVGCMNVVFCHKKDVTPLGG